MQREDSLNGKTGDNIAHDCGFEAYLLDQDGAEQMSRSRRYRNPSMRPKSGKVNRTCVDGVNMVGIIP